MSLGDPEGLEGSEAEDVVEVEPETPVVELAPGATAIAEESPSVDMLPLADLDPRGVALDPELAKRQATRAEQVVIDAAACDPSRPRPESAGLLAPADQSRSFTPTAAQESAQAAGQEVEGQPAICRRTFPGVALSVPGARSFVTHALADLSADALDEVRLMVSELASNAVEHVTTDFHVTVHRSTREIRVEVADSGTGTPTMRSVGPDAPRGRGLAIVDMLSTRWGVHQESGSAKTVWFTLKLPPAPPPA